MILKPHTLVLPASVTSEGVKKVRAVKRIPHLDLVLLIHAWPGLGVDGSEQLVPQHVHVVRDGQSRGEGH